MTSQQLIQTLMPKKIEKLESILDWATEHCNEEQFDRFNEVINEYNEVLVGYPFIDETFNVAHEISFIEPVPNEKDLMNTEHETELLKGEVNKRKAIINKLESEIHALERLQE